MPPMPVFRVLAVAIFSRLAHFGNGESGATLIEYAFIVVIIALGAVASLSNFAPIFLNFAHAVANAL